MRTVFSAVSLLAGLAAAQSTSVETLFFGPAYPTHAGATSTIPVYGTLTSATGKTSVYVVSNKPTNSRSAWSATMTVAPGTVEYAASGIQWWTGMDGGANGNMTSTSYVPISYRMTSDCAITGTTRAICSYTSTMPHELVEPVPLTTATAKDWTDDAYKSSSTMTLTGSWLNYLAVTVSGDGHGAASAQTTDDAKGAAPTQMVAGAGRAAAGLAAAGALFAL